MAEVPKQIGELVAKFDQNLDAYHTQYGETEVRVEFINPFFEALGWDVTNKAAIAEAYKDVIHEDAVKVGGRYQGAGLLLPHRRDKEVLP